MIGGTTVNFFCVSGALFLMFAFLIFITRNNKEATKHVYHLLIIFGIVFSIMLLLNAVKDLLFLSW